MNARVDKFFFYRALYLDRLGVRRRRFVEPSDRPIEDRASLPQTLRVHFWTPVPTPGANVNVHDVLPVLHARLQELALDWRVTAGEQIPRDRCDWLVCFKAVPAPADASRHRRIALLICDQAEMFWSSLPDFDAAIATSSRSFASIVASRNQNTTYIGETEPLDYLKAGRNALRTPPSRRPPVLLWHGGRYSRDALQALRPIFNTLTGNRQLELHVVSGQEPESHERWGSLLVRFLPWSKDRLKASAANSRLGVLPARASARTSYIKPASRMRCLYALGVPAIGDGRVPDVREFARGFDGPVATTPAEWRSRIEQLWNDPARLDRVAADGHRHVADNYATTHAAERWIRLLGVAA